MSLQYPSKECLATERAHYMAMIRVDENRVGSILRIHIGQPGRESFCPISNADDLHCRITFFSQLPAG